MQTVKRLYRKDYQGEDVITDLVRTNNEWNKTQEYIPNQISNLQVSNRALIIGNGPTRSGMDLNVIKNHKAGIRGRSRLQTYGCNALYRDFTPDFLVATGAEIVGEIANSDYCTDHVVYANAWAIASYTQKFYLIPQDPAWDAGSLAAYLACFDGHKKVFLLGFDGNDPGGLDWNVYNDTAGYLPATQSISEEFWTVSMSKVFNTYPDVDFVRVMPTAGYRLPERWKYYTNLRQIDFRQFVIEADL
jgi:hypothetical protein